MARPLKKTDNHKSSRGSGSGASPPHGIITYIEFGVRSGKTKMMNELWAKRPFKVGVKAAVISVEQIDITEDVEFEEVKSELL